MKTVAIDFDGVIHTYSRGWNGGEIYDPPMPGVEDALQDFKGRDWRIVVLTARGVETHAQVWAWLAEHGLDSYVDEVTSVKPPAAYYIDDRAIRFERLNGGWVTALDQIDFLEQTDGWKAVPR